MTSENTQNSTKALNRARCIHASRLPEYRVPFGARPAASNVDIFFDCYREASNVTLCYTYGLYGFSYHVFGIGTWKISCKSHASV